MVEVTDIIENKIKFPLVSVIMNCYNSAKYLREAIDSVIAQTYSNWEIIFWDNQSTDESAEVFKSYCDQRMRYFYAPEHTVLGQARNLAIEKAKGYWCGILDCDDIWSPVKLEQQLSATDSYKKIGVIYSDFNIILSNGELMKSTTKAIKTFEGDVFDSIFTEEFTACWPTVLINTSVLRKVGSFANYKCLEDFDILLRISEKYKFAFVNNKLASYRVHSGQSSVNYELMLSEKLQIMHTWGSIWAEKTALTHKKLKLLKKAIGKAYFIAGTNAVFYGDSGVKYYARSLQENLTLQAFIGLILSLFGSNFASLAISLIRKRLGYGVYWIDK